MFNEIILLVRKNKSNILEYREYNLYLYKLVLGQITEWHFLYVHYNLTSLH